MARGGRRTPSDPAPVSGPGALSRRTDGGASDRQPIRSFPAERYGQRQALSNLQSAAPMSAGGGSPPPSGPAGGGGGLPPGMAQGILGPTTRPSEPVNAGVQRPSVIPRDPDLLLRAIYQRYPHPDIGRLLNEIP